MSSSLTTIRDLAEQEYKWGFVTEIDEDRVPKGLHEDTIRLISARKNEPEFMLQWRLRAYRHWASLEKTQAEPKWANIHYEPIDYQDMVYYSAPRQKPESTLSWEITRSCCPRKKNCSNTRGESHKPPRPNPRLLVEPGIPAEDAGPGSTSAALRRMEAWPARVL